MPPLVGFLGKHELRIDDKGRITMPARFKAVLRDKIPQDADQVVVRISWDRNLRVEPLSEYAKVADQYEASSDRDPRARRRKNVVNGLAEIEKIDAGGRIRLSPDLRSLANLDRDVTLIGDNHAFEVWDSTKWQAAQEAALREMEEQNEAAAMEPRPEEDVTEHFHVPVLVKEVLELLQPRPGDVIVDGNLGTGGHSLALLERCEGEALLVGLDLDAEMIEKARQRFAANGIPSRCYVLVQADHADLARVLGTLGRTRADKILLDLGASSLHYDSKERGFSCSVDAPLDMRYDRRGGGATAADIVNGWPERDLARLFRVKGDERWAGQIARRLVERRSDRPFETTSDLAGAIGAAIPRKAWPPKIHPATRCFLALRVEVNGEDRALARALESGLEVLAPGGRMVVLTFQSHEDKVVKECFRGVSRDEVDEVDPMGRVTHQAEFRDLTRRPIRPGEEEAEANPRSRSTKLRAVEKLGAAVRAE